MLGAGRGQIDSLSEVGNDGGRAGKLVVWERSMRQSRDDRYVVTTQELNGWLGKQSWKPVTVAAKVQIWLQN
jgi:hypothetical protein